MTTHTIDNFNSTLASNLENHTPDSGGPWTNVDGVAGTWIVNAANTSLLHETTQASDGAWTVPVGLADMFAQITVAIASSYGTASSFGPCVRITNLNNFIGMRCQGSNNLQMFKRVAGSFTSLRSVTGITVTAGDVMQLTVTGNIFQMNQNGTARGATVTDSFNNTQTTAGLEYHGDALTTYATKFESNANGSSVVPAWFATRANQNFAGGPH